MRKGQSMYEYCNTDILNRGYLLEEFDYNRNFITPHEISSASSTKLYWICPNCNHSWSASLANRIYNNQKCSYCHFS